MRAALLFVSVVFVLAAACSKTAHDAQADGCPKDLLAARGTSCNEDGKTCSGGSDVRLLMCSSGKWTEMNLPPMPPKPAPAGSP